MLPGSPTGSMKHGINKNAYSRATKSCVVHAVNLFDALLLGFLEKFDLELQHGEAWPCKRCYVVRTLARNTRLRNESIEIA